MKKTFFFAALAFCIIAIAGCTNGKNKGDAKDGDSTDSEVSNGDNSGKLGPMGTFKMAEGNPLKDVDNIAYVLYPSSYENAMEEGEDINGKTTIYYKNTVADAGEKNTKLSGSDIRYPNSLLIPIYKDAKAKKGDVVLTWWQSGSGLQRAIVTDDSDPTQPRVHYLDLSSDAKGNGLADKHDNEQIKTNSFVLLKDGEMQQGAPITLNVYGELNTGVLVNVDGDKVIYTAFAGKLLEADKSQVKVVPLKPNFGVGDNVKGDFVGTFSKDYKVTKIDKNKGRVWVTSDGNEKILSILEVIK